MTARRLVLGNQHRLVVEVDEGGARFRFHIDRRAMRIVRSYIKLVYTNRPPRWWPCYGGAQATPSRARAAERALREAHELSKGAA